MVERAKDGQPLLHFELVSDVNNEQKPIAKVGIRPDSATSTAMDKVIREKFKSEKRVEGDYQVGLFVYMWVDPMYRGNGLGLELLRKARNRCVENGYDYLLIVHDDNGSGKLIKYYQECGFMPIDDMLEKGMIGKLDELRLDQ